MASQPTKSSQKWLLCGSNDIWMTPHFVQSFTLEREICFRASFKFTCTLFALAKGEKRTESTTRPLFYYSKMSRCLQIYFDSVMYEYLYAKTSIFKDKICCTPEKKVSYYTPASTMNNEQLPPIVATSVQRPVSSVSKVVIVGRFDFNVLSR